MISVGLLSSLSSSLQAMIILLAEVTSLFAFTLNYRQTFPWWTVKFQCTGELEIAEKQSRLHVVLDHSHLPSPSTRLISKKRSAARTTHVWAIFSRRNEHCRKWRQRKWHVVTVVQIPSKRTHSKTSVSFENRSFNKIPWQVLFFYLRK